MTVQGLMRFSVDVSFCRKLLRNHESRREFLVHESWITRCGKTGCEEQRCSRPIPSLALRVSVSLRSRSERITWLGRLEAYPTILEACYSGLKTTTDSGGSLIVSL